MRWILTLISALVVGTCFGMVDAHAQAALPAGETSPITLTYAGVERTVFIHMPPASTNDGPTPAVVALHGLQSSPLALEAITGLSAEADARGFIAVYPAALTTYWDDGRVQAGYQTGDPIDDVGFLDLLADTLREDYAAGPIYLVGTNNGGTMVYRQMCQSPEHFNGFAVYGTLLWDFIANDCPSPAESSNLLIMRGSNDLVFPSEGRTIDDPFDPTAPTFSTLSAIATVSFWATQLGCEAHNDSANATVYTDCANGNRLAYYRILGGGHMWSQAGEHALNAYGVEPTPVILDYLFDVPEWATVQPAVYRATPRTYTLYVPPSYNPSQPTPLVVALHGRTGTGAGMALVSGMSRVAAQDNFIVAYPDGLNYEWNSIGDLLDDPDRTQDDVQFMRDLVHDLSLDLNIDRARVYVTGFSNGGFMAHRLACSASDTFAAFAAVGSTLYYVMRAVCDGSASAPMLVMHGTADNNILWDGVVQADSSGAMHQVSYSVPDTVRYWVGHDQCDPEVYEQEELPVLGNSPDTNVVRAAFTACANDAQVVLYMVRGGGHNWPGMPGIIDERVSGVVNTDINASQVIWDWFSQFQLENAS